MKAGKIDKGKVFVVIPGLNEAKHIGNVIRKVRHQGYSNIIFVDDGSIDSSYDEGVKAGATVLKHVINLGKGAAAKTGCDYALMKGAKIICLMDADGQHKPEDLDALIGKLLSSKADIVFGYRKFDRNMPPMMKLGNMFISKVTKLLDGVDIQDTQCGFRCFTSDAYRKIRWSSTDYSMESEMIANTARNRLRHAEHEIETIYFDKFKGTTIFDGIKIFIKILRVRIFGG